METYGDISAPIYNTAKGKLEKLKLMTDLTAALNSCKNGVVRTPSEWLKASNTYDNCIKADLKSI